MGPALVGSESHIGGYAFVLCYRRIGLMDFGGKKTVGDLGLR